jgi:pimeloyl-ACP methyl ester carboxylesterase
VYFVRLLFVWNSLLLLDTFPGAGVLLTMKPVCSLFLLLEMCGITLFALPAVGGLKQEPIAPFLPPLLRFENGTQVTDVASWEERKVEVQSLLQGYILGALPTTRGPKLTKVDVINSTVYRELNGLDGATSTFLRLTFDTTDGGAVPEVDFEVELLAPRLAANTSCPLFLTQWNHRNWASIGLSRGYCAVVYPGSDVRDAAPKFQSAYPKASMMLILARAYVASITLDMFFAETASSSALPNITKDQICITGHSRNGKQSLLAASIDDRFASVVGSSPGAPIASPYHISSHNFYGEGPDAGNAGTWWLKSTEKYAAHPEKLPMDGHGVLASIAPRRAAVANGWTDHEGDINFADECNIRAAMEVYKLYQAEDNLRIIHRPGDHHGFDDVNTYFDWFDYGFGRLSTEFSLSWTGQSSIKHDPFPMSYLTPAGFDWDVWQDAFGKDTPPPPPTKKGNTEDRVKWLLQLGNEPAVFSKGETYAEDSATGTFRYRSVMMSRDFENWKATYKTHRQPLSFGNYVTANFYWSDNILSKDNCPLVIWLHPYSYATGYFQSYIRGNTVLELAQAGFCVLAFDQIGMAMRINEGGTNFYARSGSRASLFGRMVQDVKSAVDAMVCLTADGRNNRTLCGTGSDFNGPYLPYPMKGTPVLDPNNFIVAGYSLGGNVALHAAALDDRITAVASFAGFTPFRTDFNNKTTGGIQRLYEYHALLPRLGLFQDGKYDDIPYDYEELLSALVAPRPILLNTPMEDRDATFVDVQNCINRARNAWTGKFAPLFTHKINSGYTTMGANESKILIDWAVGIVGTK